MAKAKPKSDGSRAAKPSEQKAVVKEADKKVYEDKIPALHITEYPDLVDILPDLANDYRVSHIISKEAEDRKKEIAGEIGALLDAVGAASIKGDTWKVTKVPGGEQEAISPELLLAAGVSMDTVTACTVKTPKKGYILVTEVKVKQ